MRTATLRNSVDEAAGRERANALADRLENGARMLATFASGLTKEQWQTPLPHDGRKIGVIVHHVASVYPVEIGLAKTLAEGKPVTMAIVIASSLQTGSRPALDETAPIRCPGGSRDPPTHHSCR